MTCRIIFVVDIAVEIIKTSCTEMSSNVHRCTKHMAAKKKAVRKTAKKSTKKVAKRKTAKKTTKKATKRSRR
jgi:tRNA(Met) C34 N-acetyltransferase TmcA